MITSEQRDRVLSLVRSGSGRNAIARETGLSTRQVSNVAASAGLKFDRQVPLAAAEALAADHQIRRTDLTDRLLNAAAAALDRLDQPYEQVFVVGGREPATVRATVPAPTPRDVRDLLGGAAQAAGAIARLNDAEAKHGMGDQLEEAKSVIMQFGESIRLRVVLGYMREDGLPVDDYFDAEGNLLDRRDAS